MSHPMIHTDSAPFRAVPFLARDIAVERRPDATVVLRHRTPLQVQVPHIPALLRRRSQSQPAQPWLAQRRGTDRAWRTLSYGAAQEQVDAVTQALLNLDRPGGRIMVLSGNSIEHGVLAIAAMQARMPFAPITPAYALLSQDHARLKDMARLLRPCVVFVQSGQQFDAALRALRSLDCPQPTVVCVDDPVPGLTDGLWQDWLRTPVGPEVAASVAQISMDTVAKYLFTSGSTGVPKAVTMTQRVLTHALAMHTQLWTQAAAPQDCTMLDWLPWSHVAGGNGVFHNALADGGTLYIDDGKPAPALFQETLRNLREISPLRFANVPIGYAMLADALEQDDALARSFFAKLQTMAYAGARLPDEVYRRLQTLAIRHTGHRIPFVSGYGATETGPSALYVYWATDRVGLCGLPHPGVETKLVPLDDTRYELRVRSPAVTPGYLDQPEATAAAFDEEGYFRMGDAASFVDPDDPCEGLLFAGRVAEEFKLVSGTFVRVGALRVQLIDALAPYVADAVITGADRAEVGALLWPHLAACRELLGQPDASLADLAASPQLQTRLRAALQAHNLAHPGGSARIGRAMVLSAPPSMDDGEVTDKGYVNQRRALQLRSDAVDQLYATGADPLVIRLS
jgi:feruloyl-CoA synthase